MATKQDKTAFRPLADIDTITHRLLLVILFTISLCAVIYHISRDKNVIHTPIGVGENYYLNSSKSIGCVSNNGSRIKKTRWQRLRMYYC